MKRRGLLGFAFMATVMLMVSTAHSMTNSQLARKSLLNIYNAISGAEKIVGIEDLRKLPSTTLTTSTPWTDGEIEFQGVYFEDIVEAYGTGATVGRAMAFNDYQIEFEISEMTSKKGFLAFSRDGEAMSRRDKGPYWLVFPWSQYPELDARAVHGLSIWQLVDISFN